jgi:hypothetical protein
MTNINVGISYDGARWMVDVEGLGRTRATALSMVERLAIGRLATATELRLSTCVLRIKLSVPAEVITTPRVGRSSRESLDVVGLRQTGWRHDDIDFLLRTRGLSAAPDRRLRITRCARSVIRRARGSAHPRPAVWSLIREPESHPASQGPVTPAR